MTSSSSTVTTEDGGRQNIYANEPQMRVTDAQDQLTRAELTNGRWAMIGFIAGETDSVAACSSPIVLVLR